jgi:CDP-diglyceride synthetase
MAARIATGVIGGMLFVWLYTDGYHTVLAVSMGVNALALYEFTRTQPPTALWRVYMHIVWGSLLLLLCSAALCRVGSAETALAAFAMLTAGYGALQVWERRNGPGDLGPLNLLLSLAVISVPLSFLCGIATWPGGFPWLMLLFGASFGADTGGLIVGKWMGRSPLAPWLSPKKTVEGALGGIVSGGMCWALTAAWWQNELVSQTRLLAGLPGPLIWLAMLCAGMLVSSVGIGGDMFFSLLKRNAALKDYGHILPGHGGLLDRFDSLLFCAPFVYALCLLG